MAIFAAMTFPSDFERKIGFDRIRELLSANCLFGPGKEEAERIAFSTDPELILANLRQVAEFRKILESGDPFPSQDFYDLAPALSSIQTPGTYLEPDRLSELKLSLLTVSGILSFLGRKKEEYGALSDLIAEYSEDPDYLLTAIKHISSLISTILDEKSQVRSSASPELQEIRRGIAVATAQVEKRILALFKTARKSGWTPEDAEVTVRNGQLVIPVLSAHKRKISGFVRDESSTGQTVFLEPAELLELNNGIRELELAERREIIRILTAAANEIRPDIGTYLDGFRLLARIDLTRAKAKLAIQVGGAIPLVPGNSSMQWRQAIHPLLFLSHRQQKKTVVPLDLSLSPDSRVLVISGPNAGGKSICLKTAGLIGKSAPQPGPIKKFLEAPSG